MNLLIFIKNIGTIFLKNKILQHKQKLNSVNFIIITLLLKETHTHKQKYRCTPIKLITYKMNEKKNEKKQVKNGTFMFMEFIHSFDDHQIHLQ